MQHSSGSPAVIELLGRCGFDFVILDMEHTAYSIALVEDLVRAAEEILSVPGLELVAVGPGDLSQSYGEPQRGLRERPVMEALERTIAYCEPRGIGVMTIPAPDMSAELVRELVRKGARVIWYGG